MPLISYYTCRCRNFISTVAAKKKCTNIVKEGRTELCVCTHSILYVYIFIYEDSWNCCDGCSSCWFVLESRAPSGFVHCLPNREDCCCGCARRLPTNLETPIEWTRFVVMVLLLLGRLLLLLLPYRRHHHHCHHPLLDLPSIRKHPEGVPFVRDPPLEK